MMCLAFSVVVPDEYSSGVVRSCIIMTLRIEIFSIASATVVDVRVAYGHRLPLNALKLVVLTVAK